MSLITSYSGNRESRQDTIFASHGLRSSPLASLDRFSRSHSDGLYVEALKTEGSIYYSKHISMIDQWPDSLLWQDILYLGLLYTPEKNK
jgi:hypothetical protein